MSALPLLTLIVFTPWIGAVFLTLLPSGSLKVTRWITLLASLSTLAFAVRLLMGFDPQSSGFQFEETHTWIAALNVHYRLGLDGMSLLLVLLTGIVGPASLLAAWRQDQSPRLFYSLFLLLQGAALGTFLALDFFHWFCFWELSLVPAFFLIKLFGGPAGGRAAYQFFTYTLAGSVVMLLAFMALFSATGTLDFTELGKLAASGKLNGLLASVGPHVPQLVFVGVLLGLAVKAPLFPFHTWLPSTYAEAPTAASMFLTGVMSKMGVYGFLRILWPLFPSQLQSSSSVLLVMATGGVLLGAFAALRETDLKRMIAYSSLNHVSLCLVPLFALAASRTRTPDPTAAAAVFSGSLLQMFNHGISAAALFLCIGALETRASGCRRVEDFGGVRAAAPIFAGFCGIAMFSSLGLPGLNGFVSEFLILRGTFALAPGAAVMGCVGLFATALFLLTFWQRVFHGPRAGVAANGFTDARPFELSALIPLAAVMFVGGLLPQLLIGLYNPLVTSWVAALTVP